MFASENLFEHLARGLIGFGAVALAVYIGLKPGLGFAVVSLGLGAAALVALRGCPICSICTICELSCQLICPSRSDFRP